MECGGRGERGGCQVTGRWLHRGETYSVPVGGSHHEPIQTSQCKITPHGVLMDQDPVDQCACVIQYYPL